MSGGLNKYFFNVRSATTYNNGQVLATYISLRDAHVKNHSLYMAEPKEMIKKFSIGQPIDDVVATHLKVLYHLTQKSPNYSEAYVQQAAACRIVLRMVQEQPDDDDWALHMMYRLCLDLGTLAKVCEKKCQGCAPGEMLEKAADSIMACFRVCVGGKGKGSNPKRMGMIILVNQLFKIYFGINKLNLCQPLIKVIENLIPKDCYPLQEQITYSYYVGKLAVFDANYLEAMKHLSFAYDKCPARFVKNKKLILIYLVPVKMCLGYLPAKSLLERYDLLLFHDLSLALKAGNIGEFDRIVKNQRLFLIRSGIYLLVQKLKYIIFRNLFKKVYIIRQSHQLNINDFLAALEFVGVRNMSLNEVHCILANLIYDGRIKGYISHDHNTLVVSKNIAFPTIISK